MLTIYNAERVAAGRALVELGKRTGAAQVEHTPPWADITADDFSEWAAAILAGEAHYLYPSVKSGTQRRES